MRFIQIFDQNEQEILINLSFVVRIDRNRDGSATILLSSGFKEDTTVISSLQSYGELVGAIGWTRAEETVIEPPCKALLKPDSEEE